MFGPELLPTIYGFAVLLPLLSFFVILIGAKWLGDKAAWVATGAIGSASLLSFLVLLGFWLPKHFPPPPHVGGHATHAEEHPGDHPAPAAEAPAAEKHTSAAALPPTFVANAPHEPPPASGEEIKPSAAAEGEEHGHGESGPHFTGEYYELGVFGPLRITISYYIDSLTVCMFCMVTLIATLIHLYAIGYMHDELHAVTDNEVTLKDGHALKRPGRFPRFFQYLSLFCFSMLGLVLAGNIAMVFCFWELVGICSYFLIGFYIERKSASNAANKAFIVNRVGDFGMIIGLMALWSTLGTFAFGDIETKDEEGKVVSVERGIFSQVRPGPKHELIVPPSMFAAGTPIEARPALAELYADHPGTTTGRQGAESEFVARNPGKGWGYWLLVIAGIGIFCGCVGKSAQFPLHVWLPDAMEGPTPVSALVHSATMVAAGVYLVGRFYPVFTPEVLLVIAIIGTITMLLGASIAFAANDIKRVLAYSTVSQLGLMMLALGVGGWAAGMMHLITHAFFKSLLFMCSGSVIHAVHTNDMRKMGGLFHKMPVTAITMLIGCLAIAGVAVPFVVGLSGYYSKDAILEQALLFWRFNGTPQAGVFFILAVFGAAMTTCYMFRMWFLTFVGQPRDHHAYDHAHESPPVMYLPLVILAVFAVSVAWNVALLGYGLIAAGFFILLGIQQGWFKRSPAASHGHGHDDHGHDAHGHEGHDHGHDDHGHGHAHAAHDDHAHAPAGPTFTWSWVTLMLVGTICVGGLFHVAVLRSLPEDSWIYGLSLTQLLEQSRPVGTAADQPAHWLAWTWPNEHTAHEPANFPTIVVPATLIASSSWIVGILLASAFYWFGWLSAADVRRQFAPLHTALVNKWWFDELYDFLLVKPAFVISRLIAGFDRQVIDGFIDWLGRSTVWFSKRWEFVADQSIVDGFVNLLAGWTYSLGLSLRSVQTGRIRQYVMFIVIGAVTIFVLISFFWSPTLPPAKAAPQPSTHIEK